MINGITYFKKKSPYSGDVTKNCALDGYEVDNNFYVLEGRDVKSVEIESNDIVINFMNGESVRAKEALGKAGVTNIEFDEKEGILTVTQDGEIHKISGFSTTSTTIASDDTIIGDGSKKAPLGIAPLYKTGQFKPVIKVVDATCGEQLPCECHNVHIGDRYITREYVSDYGLLYNYDAVKRIACDLRDASSPWRIPTKEDWDNMLNAVEPCQKYRNHSNAASNKWLGKMAGKMLKSRNLWVSCDCMETDCDCSGTCISYDDSCKCCSCSSNEVTCESSSNSCDSSYCGKYDECNCGQDKITSEGIDAFGFRITPAGYADDGKSYNYFGERAYFWTATNSNCQNVYIKRFDFDRTTVYQNVVAGTNYLSLRLVKDYDGGNFAESEEILSSFCPTVLMPSADGTHKVWTAVNISMDCKCGCAIKPNDGQHLTRTVHYFINEWDGKRWRRNELHEGDSIVVRKCYHGKTNVEYRLVDHKLSEVNKLVADDVLDIIKPKINSINEKLEEEINRSIAKDALIDGVINDELKPNIEKNASDIATVNTNLVTAIDNINSSIATVNQNLVDAINTINGGIATEIQERKDADAALQEQVTANKEAIDTEVERATTKDAELEESIATETEERKAKDEELEAKIDEHQSESDSRYNELNERVTANKNSIVDLETKTDETNSNLAHTNQVLSDFGTETAKAFEQINKVITDGFNTINGGIATEIQERKDADEAEKDERISNDDEIRGTILTSDGTQFNTEDGVLTLKSKDATNDIKVQFTMNFGEF
jgi:hypothetical protein